MKSTTISELMVKDHIKIIRLLNNLEIDLKESNKELIKSIDNFIWKLEKHFFTEEKAIFIHYNPEEDSEFGKMISDVMKDHDAIYKSINAMKTAINDNDDFNFFDFKKMLVKHKNFEDEYLYPKFDQELDESIKVLIINRINEII
jgi:iron-sulfur cluster repair protein YtfE (RIC family)